MFNLIWNYEIFGMSHHEKCGMLEGKTTSLASSDVIWGCAYVRWVWFEAARGLDVLQEKHVAPLKIPISSMIQVESTHS